MSERPPLRFDRRELAGAFGDLGTDFPLLVGLVLACGLNGGGVLAIAGALQIATGLLYRMPMPVEPLKAMAAIAIAQKLPPGVIAGAGITLGAMMLFLTATGLLEGIARAVPKSVVRGIQCGLGLQLATLAARQFLPAGGAAGWILAAASAAIVVVLMGNERLPPALLVVGLGLAYAWAAGLDPRALAGGFGFHLPSFAPPTAADAGRGFLLIAVPQLPLSLGNSVLATRQVSQDLFPDRAPSIRKIGFTYAAMNLIAPLFGGVPSCHGSGGMAGHYAFGARTGGSVVIYGALFLILGLFFGGAFAQVVAAFPKPTLGVLLGFEGLSTLGLIRDQAGDRRDFALVLLLGLIAAFTPYGYLTALVAGTALNALKDRIGLTALR
ncbi:MAG: putative sulfate/molybdate transporter [Elusimicrobia bacterium]|nr:putative sulfate/molybdate transporter [Elusimicrobiota bacterium]